MSCLSNVAWCWETKITSSSTTFVDVVVGDRCDIHVAHRDFLIHLLAVFLGKKNQSWSFFAALFSVEANRMDAGKLIWRNKHKPPSVSLRGLSHLCLTQFWCLQSKYSFEDEANEWKADPRGYKGGSIVVVMLNSSKRKKPENYKCLWMTEWYSFL